LTKIAIDTEQLREIEVVERAVEHRRRALIVVGRVNVKRAWLERLHKILAEGIPVALEHEPAVQRSDRDRVIELVGKTGTILVQVVVSKMNAGARDDRPRGTLPRPGDGGP